MEKLKQLQTQLNDLNALLKRDIEEFPPATRVGWAARQQQAKTEIPSLRKEFFAELEGALFKVYVVGNKNVALNKQFVDNLAKQAPTTAPSDIYGDIATQMMPLLGSGGEITTVAWQRFLDITGDYSDYYGSYPSEAPPAPLNSSAKNLEGLRLLIKNIVQRYWGETLNKPFVYQSVFNWSLELPSDFSFGFVVVYLDSEDDKERNTMFNKKPSYTISFEQEDTSSEEAVTKLIEKAKKHIKKGK